MLLMYQNKNKHTSSVKFLLKSISMSVLCEIVQEIAIFKQSFPQITVKWRGDTYNF